MKKLIIIVAIVAIVLFPFIISVYFNSLSLTIEIAIAFGSLLAGVAALYSLIELERQRKVTYKPKIIIPYPVKYSIYWKDPTQDPFEFVFEPDWGTSLPPKQQDKEIKIALYNIGLGTAKSIKIAFTFKINVFADIIRSIDQFPVEVNEKIVAFGKKYVAGEPTHPFFSFSSHDDQKLISYMHPTSVDPNPWMISIPSAYSNFLAIYSLYASNNRNSMNAIPHKIPPLNVIISFEDIEDEKKEIKYSLFFQSWFEMHNIEPGLLIHGSIEMIGSSSSFLSSYNPKHMASIKK